MSEVEVPSLLPLAVRARLAQARRLTTPCGDGHIVWHAWEPEGARRAGVAPLVLFHGGSGSWTHWVKNILPLVDAGRWVLAADLPGFGESTPPPGGTDADAMVAPLAAGLRALLAGEPVDLVGFSFGGMTAGLLLAEHPGLARRLVVAAHRSGGQAQFIERPVAQDQSGKLALLLEQMRRDRPGSCWPNTRRWRSAWCWWARRPWAWCPGGSSSSKAGAT